MDKVETRSSGIMKSRNRAPYIIQCLCGRGRAVETSADGLIGEAREHCLRLDTGKGVLVGRKDGIMSANHVGGGERETYSRFGS